MKLIPHSVGLFVVATAAAILAACTPLPRAELEAYRQTFNAFESVSNDVLNIVAPYERAATRKSSYTRADCPNNQPAVLSSDAFCYSIRDNFASIGDPQLVASYRNLINMVSRFNAIVVGYADGASFQFIKQDVDEFGNLVGVFGSTAASEFAGLVSEGTPIVQATADLTDRRDLVEFVNLNFQLVDQAFEEMALQSGALYSNVVTGTTLLRQSGSGNSSALASRKTEMREIIANWTVLMDETRRLLGEMTFAVSNPENLEVRLRNIGENSIQINAGFAVLEQQISELGTGGAFQ